MNGCRRLSRDKLTDSQLGGKYDKMRAIFSRDFQCAFGGYRLEPSTEVSIRAVGG